MTTRSTPTRYLAAAAAIPLAAVVLAGCGGGNSSNASSPAKPAAKPAASHGATIRTAKTSLGTILVDSKGDTIYLFRKDTGTKSTCTGACATAWPPVRATGTPTLGSGLSASKVGTTPRSDGQPQVTYNGHPLYLFVKDLKPGDVNGQGVNAFGAGWFVMSPAGNQIGSATAAAAKPAPKPAPRPAAPAPTPRPAAPKPAATPPAAAKPAPSGNGIPQNNGGDGDADNNGGPSDGDGGI
jgi:predicted lipoprotein with Yx(FWY)xxD motif